MKREKANSEMVLKCVGRRKKLTKSRESLIRELRDVEKTGSSETEGSTVASEMSLARIITYVVVVHAQIGGIDKNDRDPER